jgi:hypothetical protein
VALLTAQEMSIAGLAPAYGAVAASDTFSNDGAVFLHVKNANAGADTVTVVSVKTCDQGTAHNLTVNVPATTGDRMIGPFPTSRFNDPTTGLVTVQHSVTSSVTCALVRCVDVK